MKYDQFDSHVPYEEGLKVIGVGLPRTGTTSMLTALRILYGVRGYHMEEVFKKDTSDFWSAMQRGTPSLEDIRAHFNEYAHA